MYARSESKIAALTFTACCCTYFVWKQKEEEREGGGSFERHLGAGTTVV